MADFGRKYVAKKIQKSMRIGSGVRIDRREVEKFGFEAIYDWVNNQGWVVYHMYNQNPATGEWLHTTTIITKNWASIIVALNDLYKTFLEVSPKDIAGYNGSHVLQFAESFREAFNHLIELRECGDLEDPVRSVAYGTWSRQSPGEDYWRNRRISSGADRPRIDDMVGQSTA